MDQLLDDLFAKRRSVREGALSSIIDGLSISYCSQFAGQNFATLLYRCQNSFKRGSPEEIVLASRVLGLLSITIGCGVNADELYKESFPIISQALNSRTESLLLSVIDCLAISTFVCANFFQTEAAMQMLWHVTQLNPGGNVLSAAISAWSLLLTTVDVWNLDRNYWRGAISYLLSLLEGDDQSIWKAAGEAIALIWEAGFLERFSRNTARDRIHLKDWTYFLDVFEDGCFHATTLKIGKHSLQLHTLSELVQVHFIQRFLGRGFAAHMLENEFLHEVFNFTTKEKISEERRHRDNEEYLGMSNRPTRLAISKRRTQLMKKNRMLKWAAFWSIEDEREAIYDA